MSAAARLAEAVERATPRLLALSDAAASTPRAAGKWSPKQVIGHLIDSASNNHGRFVRAQLYRYRFTRRGEAGWWTRSLIGEWMTPIPRST